MLYARQRMEYFPVLGPNLGCIVLRGVGNNGVAESWEILALEISSGLLVSIEWPNVRGSKSISPIKRPALTSLGIHDEAQLASCTREGHVPQSTHQTDSAIDLLFPTSCCGPFPAEATTAKVQTLLAALRYSVFENVRYC